MPTKKWARSSDDWLNPSERDGLILECPELTSNEKLVLWAIGHHMYTGNDAWPSQARIAALTALSHKTVKRVVRALGGRGILVTKRAAAGNRVNHYSVAWDWLGETIKPAATGGVTETPLEGRGDPTPAPERPGQTTARRVTPTPGGVTEFARQGRKDPSAGSRRPPEGERNGPPKGEQKGLPVPLPTAGPDEGGRFDQEEAEGSPTLVEAAADACPPDRDADPDEGVESEPDEIPPCEGASDTPHDTASPTPCKTLADRIRELATLDLDDFGDHDQADEPEEPDERTVPLSPAVDPELAEARAYQERKDAEERQTLALAKQRAAELDRSLAKARDPALPVEKRVQHAAHLVRGVEKLAEAVGHRVRVYLLKSTVRFSHWSDECLAAIEQLAPEVRTWDLFLGFSTVSDMEQNCWRVAVKENVWPDVAGQAEFAAGQRLQRELGIVSYREPSPLAAVRKYREGLIDRNGERVTPPTPAPAADTAAVA